MGIRFRKSVKVAPGVRVNVGKKSASVSVGGKRGRYTVSSTGRTTSSASIPGTGLSYVSSSGPTKKKQTAAVGSGRSYPSRGAKIGGIAMLVLAGLAFLIGLVSISVGGAVFLAMGAVFLLLGLLLLKKSKNKPED